MNRKKLIIGAAIGIALLCVTLTVFGIQKWRKSHQPKAQQKILVANLAYCNANNDKPCVESFSVDADGNMLVNLLTPSSFYPRFYLTISNDVTSNQYKCKKVKGFPTNIYCIGAEMYPGEPLQFTLFSIKDDTVMAEGKFAIIGLLLPNPAGEATTLAAPLMTEAPATEAPIELATPILTDIFTPTPDITSYPNPSSYP